MTALALDAPAAKPIPSTPRSARQRLPAAERTTQILDAALVVFTERGFKASRIDDIAAQAGLSKGGVYTHFKSKDAIFEVLLSRSLTPSRSAPGQLAPDAAITVDVLIEQFIEPMYATLADPVERLVQDKHSLSELASNKRVHIAMRRELLAP